LWRGGGKTGGEKRHFVDVSVKMVLGKNIHKGKRGECVL